MTATRIVYRMEDNDHAGPFYGGVVDMKAMADHVSWMRFDSKPVPDTLEGFLYKLVTGEDTIDAIKTDATHPHHNVDILGADLEGEGGEPAPEGEWRVGVRDPATVLHWFPPQSLAWFESIGQRVVKYEVPAAEVRDGTYQLMFRTDHAKVLETIRPTEFNA